MGAVAVDFITDPESRRRKVIEFSSYIRVDDPEELRVGGVPGVYVRTKAGSFVFRPGRYWFPEVALAEALCRTMDLDTSRLLAEAVQASTTAVSHQ